MTNVGPGRTTKGTALTEFRTSTERANCREELLVAFNWLWRLSGIPQVALCIGTDRATGDALGPLVGKELESWQRRPFEVIGTLDNPVHATNLVGILGSRPELRDARILAIDASLGKAADVGSISLGIGSLRPGAGVNKELPAVGRYYVTGTVNIGGFMDYYVLQNTRLALVMKMAHLIAEGIKSSLCFSSPPET